MKEPLFDPKENYREKLHSLKNRIQELLLITESCLLSKNGHRRLKLLRTKLLELREDIFRELNEQIKPVTESRTFNPLEILREMFPPWHEIKLMVDAEIPARIKARGLEEDFRNVIENLILNAYEAGASKIRIRCRKESETLKVLVIDNGRGIDERDLPFIFLPGYSTKKSGSGIGLYQVWKTAIANGWEIRVTSLKEGGTEFELNLDISE